MRIGSRTLFYVTHATGTQPMSLVQLIDWVSKTKAGPARSKLLSGLEITTTKEESVENETRRVAIAQIGEILRSRSAAAAQAVLEGLGPLPDQV
jgi:hypothetical protein